MDGRRAIAERLAERAAATVSDRRARLLDVGCGSGDLGLALGGQGFTAVDGIETSEAWIEAAANTGAYLRLIKASLVDGVPLSDDVYDAALCRSFSGDNAAVTLKEVARLVRAGGRAMLVMHRRPFETPAFGAALKRLHDLGQASLVRTEELPETGPDLRLLELDVHW